MYSRLSRALSCVLTCSMTLCLMSTPAVMATETDEQEPVVLGADEPAADTDEAVVLDGEADETAGDAQGDERDAGDEQAADSADEKADDDASKGNDDEDVEAKKTEGSVTDNAAQKQGTALEAQSTKAQSDAFAAKYVGTIPDGTYSFVSTLSNGYAMDLRGSSKADGATIIVWSPSSNNNQRWEIKSAGGGYVTIKSVCSGKYLQAGYNGKAEAVVQCARNTSNRGQLWIACVDGSSYKFVPATDLNRSLYVSGSSVVVAPASKAGQQNSHWRIKISEDAMNALAKAHKSDLPNGSYMFKSASNDNLALQTANASTDNSALAQVGTKGCLTSQGWIVSHDSTGYVTFVNDRSARALDVRGSKCVAGTQLIQWTKSDKFQRNQRWVAIKNSDGSYSLMTSLLGDILCIGATKLSNGSEVRLAQKGTDGSQRWNIEKVPERFSHLQDVAEGQYAIRTALDTSKSLDVPGSSKSATGVTVKLWNFNGTDNQMWTLTQDERGFVHLRAKHSGLFLAYRDGRLTQTPYDDGWVFESAGNGTYNIYDARTGLYLDVRRSNTDIKTNQIITYSKSSGNNQKWQVSSPTIGVNTPIMGSATVKQAAAVRYVKSLLGKKTLPSKWVKDGETVEKIVKYFYEEGAAENVRADIALAQAIHETACFQYTGDVKPEQYNFAGIGATGGGVRGNSFGSARIGIRAQIQHLKAYASTQALKKSCVDPRFQYVNRGCATTIAGLANKWAIDSVYATSILRYLNAMMKA